MTANRRFYGVGKQYLDGGRVRRPVCKRAVVTVYERFDRCENRAILDGWPVRKPAVVTVYQRFYGVENQ